jgi:hypothetical protein
MLSRQGRLSASAAAVMLLGWAQVARHDQVVFIHVRLCGHPSLGSLPLPVPRRNDRSDDRCTMACHAAIRVRRSPDDDEVDGMEDWA